MDAVQPSSERFLFGARFRLRLIVLVVKGARYRRYRIRFVVLVILVPLALGLLRFQRDRETEAAADAEPAAATTNVFQQAYFVSWLLSRRLIMAPSFDASSQWLPYGLACRQTRHVSIF